MLNCVGIGTVSLLEHLHYYYLAPMESLLYTPLQLLGDNKLD